MAGTASGRSAACAAAAAAARGRPGPVAARRARGNARKRILRTTRAADANADADADAEANVQGVDEDADFEKRLSKLKSAKGSSGKKKEAEKKRKGLSSFRKSAEMDFTGETVYYEGKPSAGDLAVNAALGATLIWLPLSISAVGRYLWLSYRVTDKRITVTNSSPLRKETLDVGYGEIVDVVAVGRGVGAWGDMVITLRDGEKLELRSVDEWLDLKRYILERVAEANANATRDPQGDQASTKGF